MTLKHFEICGGIKIRQNIEYLHNGGTLHAADLAENIGEKYKKRRGKERTSQFQKRKIFDEIEDK